MSRPEERTAPTEQITLQTKSFICLIIGLLASTCGNSAEKFFEATQRTLLRDTPFAVPANEWVVIGRIVFVPNGSTRNQTFTGSVTSVMPVELLVLEEPDFLNFEVNQPYTATFASGLTTSVDFNIPVEPGGYQFVIDNRGSTSIVDITATIVFEQEEIIDPNILPPVL